MGLWRLLALWVEIISNDFERHGRKFTQKMSMVESMKTNPSFVEMN